MKKRVLIFGINIIVFFQVLFSACNSERVYDTMEDLDSNAWSEQREMVYKVSIEDATVPYTVYYSIRYDNNYPFYNLYINRRIEDSAGRFLNKKLQGMDLFNPATGVPYGSGIGSKKDYLIVAEENYLFPHKGTFIVKLKQYMRQENIEGIGAVGLRVEKSIKK